MMQTLLYLIKQKHSSYKRQITNTKLLQQNIFKKKQRKKPNYIFDLFDLKLHWLFILLSVNSK